MCSASFGRVNFDGRGSEVDTRMMDGRVVFVNVKVGGKKCCLKLFFFFLFVGPCDVAL